MKLKVYEQLLAMNQGFDQVRRTLHALASCPDVDRGEIHRFQQLAAEARAATNSLSSIINCSLSRNQHCSIPDHASFPSALRCGV